MSVPTAKLIIESSTPDEVQRAVARQAIAAGDAETLVALAKVKNLASDVDIVLSTSDDINVLLAWAQRHGRRPSDLAQRFAREHRTRLLARVAQAPDLDHGVYGTIAQRGGAAVLAAVIANPSAPMTLRSECATRLCSTLKSSSTVRLDYTVLERDRNLAIAAAMETSNIRVVRALTHHLDENDPYTVSLCAERFEAAIISSNEDPDWEAVVEISSAIADAGCDEMTLDRLAAAVNGLPAYHDLYRERQRSAVAMLRSDAAGFDELVARIDGARSVDAVHSALKIALAQPAPGRRLQRAHAVALTNPHLDVNRYRPVLRELRLGAARSVVPTLLAQERIGVLAMLIERFDIRALVPSAMLGDVVTALCNHRNPPHILLRRYPKPLLEPSQALATFTYDMLCSQGWQEEVGAAAVAAFGDDVNAWEMFARLVDEWHEPLTALLDSICALS